LAESGSHRHGRKRTAQQQHRLVAFADSEDVVGRTKADGMAEETTHGPPRRVDRRLAERRLVEAFRVEPIVISPRLGDFNEDLRLLGADALRAAGRVQIAAQDVARFMELAA